MKPRKPKKPRADWFPKFAQKAVEKIRTLPMGNVIVEVGNRRAMVRTIPHTVERSRQIVDVLAHWKSDLFEFEKTRSATVGGFRYQVEPYLDKPSVAALLSYTGFAKERGALTPEEMAHCRKFLPKTADTAWRVHVGVMVRSALDEIHNAGILASPRKLLVLGFTKKTRHSRQKPILTYVGG